MSQTSQRAVRLAIARISAPHYRYAQIMALAVFLALCGIEASREARAQSSASSELRQRLSLDLAAADPMARRRTLYDLSFHPQREMRIFAMEQLSGLAPDAHLRARVEQLAAAEPDPVVRGHARLLAAEWSVPSSPRAPNLLPHAPREPLQRVPAPQIMFDRHVAPVGFADPPRRLGAAQYAIGDQFQPAAPFWIRSSSTSVPTDVGRELVGANPIQLSSFQPPVLNRPLNAAPDDNFLNEVVEPAELFQYPRDAPLGFTGPSGVLPTEYQLDNHFVPIEDRWRLGMPQWDRYGRDFPVGEDYPLKVGSLLDPYNLNVLKGDYPIIGQHTFLNITAIEFMLQEYRQTPTPTTPFESTHDPFQESFFGDPNQYSFVNNLKLSLELFHGNEAFKPADWRIRLEPIFNVNFLKVEELGVTRPDVRKGTSRGRTDFSLEQWFFEAKLADISPDYDFVAMRAGSQFFVSDFRGFLMRDVNRGVRLFGTRLANRDQFNLVWFDQTEKDTNSLLNTFDDRHQNTVVANYFRQDFVFPGFTAQASFHFNLDRPSTKFDDNNFLVRPDPTGVFREHEVEAYYFGLAGDGHIGRINITHQLYYAFGHDSLNPIGGCEQSIEAQMAALELSYDRDWIRFRTSYFFASGDNDPNDREAGGFDTILDDPIFAGGEFSYWQRQQIKLFGANLVQQRSLVPNLRSSKTQGQANFVNPGLHLFNIGMDVELAPKLRAIANANYLRFDTVNVLRTFTFQGDIGKDIGTDLSLGFEWRPYLNDNVVVVFGSAVLIPARGLKDLFDSEVPNNIAQLSGMQSRSQQFQHHFVELALMY